MDSLSSCVSNLIEQKLIHSVTPLTLDFFCLVSAVSLEITQRQPGPQFLSKQTCTGQSNPINNGWLAATRPATKADDKDLVASGDEIFGNERGGIHVVNQVHPPKQEWVTNGHNGFPAMHFINCYFCC